MRSTFSGLEIARSALNAAQVSLDVTGQNIANSNTENYTRQKVDLVALNYNSGVYKTAISKNDSVGQGVNVSKISQYRDSFLDSTVRTSNANYNTNAKQLSALSDIEAVFDETDTDGLQAMITDFYTQLQSLSNHVGDVEYTNILRSAAEKVTQVLHQYTSQLSQIRSDQQGSLEIGVTDVNTLVDKINSVNKMIKDQTMRGAVTNELLDIRNGYLDELSAYMKIDVTENNDGSVSVASAGIDVLAADFSVAGSGGVISVLADTGSGPQVFNTESGSLYGYLQVLNGDGVGGAFRGLTYYDNALDTFAVNFATTFNDLNSGEDPASPKPLFTGYTAGDPITAENISISAAWLNDPDYVVTAYSSDTDANANVVRMINAMDNKSTALNATFAAYSRMLIGDINIDVRYQKEMAGMTGSILDSASMQRESLSGVSVNEETVNMIKYEKSFQAAARVMTAMDEALDVIINKMGIVGR